MIQIKFNNATQVQLIDQAGNTVQNVGEFLSPTEFYYSGNTFSKNDKNYYKFAITGSNVQVSGQITEVTEPYQFFNLFAGCEAITDASQLILSAPTMKDFCYANMFLDCTNLTSPPQIQASTLDMWCYSSMFGNCSSLTAVPTLSATTLAPYCYYCMFYGCKSLSSSPYLPAQTLQDWCYNSMFYECKNLTSISADFNSWGENATTNWVTGIDTEGKFYNNNVAVIFGVDNIPENWKNDEGLPLTFKGLSANNYVQLQCSGNEPIDVELKYRKNSGSWTDYNIGSKIPFERGEVVSFSGNNDHLTEYDKNTYHFNLTGLIESYGNIQSLLNFSNVAPDWCYEILFQQCNKLVSAPNMPATTVGKNSYQEMFAWCKNLSSAPDILPATELKDFCYYQMFEACESLVTAPQLPATELAQSCYNHMFYDCFSLNHAPQLPAETLETNCYYAMFQNCSSLIIAPQLPAETLVRGCYAFMFKGCQHLTSISVNFTDWGDYSNTHNWVQDVMTSGVFTCPSALPKGYSTHTIPFNWTVINT